jgi:hypothetical protein
VTRLCSSGCTFVTGENPEAIALFTQISIDQNSFSTAAAAFSTALPSATSRGSTIALAPTDSISRFAASSPSTLRTMRPTLARCVPNSRAVAQAGRRSRNHGNFVRQFVTDRSDWGVSPK